MKTHREKLEAFVALCSLEWQRRDGISWAYGELENYRSNGQTEAAMDRLLSAFTYIERNRHVSPDVLEKLLNAAIEGTVVNPLDRDLVTMENVMAEGRYKYWAAVLAGAPNAEWLRGSYAFGRAQFKRRYAVALADPSKRAW